MKLSPITVPYRAIQRASSVLVLAAIAIGSDMSGMMGGSAAVVGLAAAAVLATTAYELAYYRRFEYHLAEDTLDIRSGVFARRERELPYRRIQNVDVTRNAVARLLGIAAVDLETAGGSRTEGSIRYVSTLEADRLRAEIRARKRGADGRTTPPGSEGADDEEELYAITPAELGLVGALSFDARVVGALTLLGPGSVPFLSGGGFDPVSVVLAMGGVLVAGLLLGAWALGIAVAVVNYYGFRLTRTEDELRYERGLFRRYSGSIPLSKVQAVRIGDNPLKRRFGYATLSVETAGYAPGSGRDRGSQVAVPIARRARIDALSAEIEPVREVAFERPPARVRRRYTVRYLIVVGALVAAAFAVDRVTGIGLPWYAPAGLAVLTPAAAHLAWRHRGYWLGPDHVVTRNGFWSRSTTVVPHYRIQTVIDSRTVFQRRYGVATVVVDTAGSYSLVGQTAAAVDLEVGDAVALREALADRLQASLAGRRGRPGALEPPGASRRGP